jgi:hypothetical protein
MNAFGVFLLLVFLVGTFAAVSDNNNINQRTPEQIAGSDGVTPNANVIILPLNRKPHNNHSRSLLASSTLSVFGSVRETG